MAVGSKVVVTVPDNPWGDSGGEQQAHGTVREIVNEKNIVITIAQGVYNLLGEGKHNVTLWRDVWQLNVHGYQVKLKK